MSVEIVKEKVLDNHAETRKTRGMAASYRRKPGTQRYDQFGDPVQGEFDQYNRPFPVAQTGRTSNEEWEKLFPTSKAIAPVALPAPMSATGAAMANAAPTVPFTARDAMGADYAQRTGRQLFADAPAAFPRVQAPVVSTPVTTPASGNNPMFDAMNKLPFTSGSTLTRQGITPAQFHETGAGFTADVPNAAGQMRNVAVTPTGMQAAEVKFSPDAQRMFGKNYSELTPPQRAQVLRQNLPATPPGTVTDTGATYRGGGWTDFATPQGQVSEYNPRNDPEGRAYALANQAATRATTPPGPGRIYDQTGNVTADYAEGSGKYSSLPKPVPVAKAPATPLEPLVPIGTQNQTPATSAPPPAVSRQPIAGGLQFPKFDELPIPGVPPEADFTRTAKPPEQMSADEIEGLNRARAGRNAPTFAPGTSGAIDPFQKQVQQQAQATATEDEANRKKAALTKYYGG